jgi:hypothetical protein
LLRGEFGQSPDGHYLITAIIKKDGTAYAFQGSTQLTIDRGMIAFGSVENEDYEKLYRAYLAMEDWIALTRARKPKQVGREGRLYAIDAPPIDKMAPFNNIRWKVWLDPDRNYLPVRSSKWFIKDGRDLHAQDREIELKEVTPGVWAPVRGVIKNYNMTVGGPIFGKCGGLFELRIIEEKSRFNVALPKDLFEIKIPVGTTVVDRIRNVVYTEGYSKPDEYLASLAGRGKKAVAELPPGDRSPIIIPDTRRPWPTAWIALLVTAVLAVVLGGLVAWRRRRTTA